MKRVALLLLLALPAGAHAATPALFADRGGALSFGTPDVSEDTLEAFARRAQQTPGVWLQVDAQLAQDGIAFALHDTTLDRTTTCAGALADLTAPQVDPCVVDVLGVGSDQLTSSVPKPAGGSVVHPPRLADVLALAKRTGAPVDLTLPTGGAAPVLALVATAGLPATGLIVSSSDPATLDAAKQARPGVQTELLAAGTGIAAVTNANARGYDWLASPSVPDSATVAAARTFGVKLRPGPLNTAASVQSAASAGVEGILTDDVPLARRALGLPELPAMGTTGASGATGPTGSGPAPLGGPAGPAGPTAMQQDAAATLKLVDTHRHTVLLRKTLTVALSGRKDTSARVRITARQVLLARAQLRLGHSGRQYRQLRLRPAGRRLLADARGPVALTVSSVVDGRAGTARVVLR